MALTKAIYNKGFSGNSSILPRSNFGVGGQESSTQSLTVYSLDRCGEIRSAPFATTVRRITSASCARRFADFAQQADLLNPKNGSKLPSWDFANPPNRYRQA